MSQESIAASLIMEQPVWPVTVSKSPAQTKTDGAGNPSPKTVSTTAGDIEVQIPKLRAGSFPLAAGAAAP